MEYYESSSDESSSEGEMRIPEKRQRGRPKKTKAGAQSGGARSGGAKSGGNVKEFLNKHKGKIAIGTTIGLGLIKAFLNSQTPKAHYDKPLFYGTGKKKGGRKMLSSDHPMYIKPRQPRKMFNPINKSQDQWEYGQTPTPHLQSEKGWDQDDEEQPNKTRMSPYEEYQKYLKLSHLRNMQTGLANRLNNHGLRLKTTNQEDAENRVRNKYAIRV